ncbi:hypothetical protein PR048_002503 [Dryococelus australis]|uniref:Uncharacterized protein n=1 Tax=Dryococelus australis TaxID=614101 RepID=A0ABQ9IL42_9NEOP|nr:hypothetical protein PR048_002503 [Dryococelus australis]
MLQDSASGHYKSLVRKCGCWGMAADPCWGGTGRVWRDTPLRRLRALGLRSHNRIFWVDIERGNVHIRSFGEAFALAYLQPELLAQISWFPYSCWQETDELLNDRTFQYHTTLPYSVTRAEDRSSLEKEGNVTAWVSLGGTARQSAPSQVLGGRGHRGELKSASVTERFDCSPPTKAKRVQSLDSSLRIFAKWESCLTMALVDGFSRRSPVSSALSFQRCSILTSFHPHRLSRSHC